MQEEKGGIYHNFCIDVTILFSLYYEKMKKMLCRPFLSIISNYNYSYSFKDRKFFYFSNQLYILKKCAYRLIFENNCKEYLLLQSFAIQNV